MTQSIPPTKEDIKKSIGYKLDYSSFIREVIGPYCICNPSFQMKEFHEEWIESFENNRFNCLLAPRGHSKSWMVACYVIWRIIKNPRIRILIVTINQDMANSMMTFVQRHLESNDILTTLFGQQRGYVEWSRDTLRVFHAGNQKDPTLKVLGTTGGKVGGHYNIIILDDITDRENSRTDHRRKTLVHQLNNEIMPMLEPDGKVLVTGTRWHDADIYHTLSKNPDYNYCIYKALIRESEEAKKFCYSDEIRTLANNEFKDTVRNFISTLPEDKKPIVLWEERFPYEELARIRRSDGDISFQMQYQNEIISTEDSPIKREWIEYSTENYAKEHKRIIDSGGTFQPFMGVDLASKGEESDYFTITIIGIHEGKIFVMDGLKTKASMFKQFELIKSFDSKWQPNKIGIEQAAQQKMIVDQLTESTILPIIPIKSSIVNDRMSRVQRLSVLFETGRVYLNPKLTEWADEMIVFPRGKNDDSIDSLCFAIQSSQTEEEKSGIDWTLAADMVSAKSNKDVKHVGDRYWLHKT